MRIANRQVRDEIHRLERLGYRAERSGGDHFKLIHPEYGTVHLPNTPSDWRWLKNLRSQVANQMGISVGELLDRVGVDRQRSGRTKAKVRTGGSRPSDIVRLAINAAESDPAPPVNAVTPESRERDVRAQIQELEVRSNLSVPGSTEQRSLNSAIACLRNELVQLVTDREAA